MPVHDDQKLFEFLVLEGAQAGLSWSTVLKKRETYREAFSNYDPQIIARYSAKDFARLMDNPGIIRNRLKIESTIDNAKAILKVQEEMGSLDALVWSFVNGKTIVNQWQTWKDVPAQSPESLAMSKELRRRGFRFVGPTICYAFMQAMGLVDDHLTNCFRHRKA